MHGPLCEIGLIEVLQLLERGRRSGVLSISGAPDEPRQVYIAAGMIVAIEPVAGDAATRRALLTRHLVGEPTQPHHFFNGDRPRCDRSHDQDQSNSLHHRIGVLDHAKDREIPAAFNSLRHQPTP